MGVQRKVAKRRPVRAEGSQIFLLIYRRDTVTSAHAICNLKINNYACTGDLEWNFVLVLI